MKKNVSFSLLGLILLLAVGIAASSVYYQYTYSDLQTKYEVSNTTLYKTMGDYQEKEQILDATLQNLSISEKREDVLGEKYEVVETEKEGLQSELAKAKNAIESLEKKKRDLERENKNLKDDVTSLQFDVVQLGEEVDDLERAVNCLYNQVKSLNATATPCATKP